MTEPAVPQGVPDTVPQLAQVRVPLRDAGAVLATPDAQGRTPIVVVVSRPNRIMVPLLVVGLVVAATGVIAGMSGGSPLLPPASVLVGLVLAILAVARSFFVQVPEGATALLLRKGAHAGTLGPGSNVLPPWIATSHLVTRREIPFDPPIVDAPTRDNVRASVDSLLTLQITDPFRFVYQITAADFDAVLAASCQDALRRMIRALTWNQIADLTRQATEGLRAELSAAAAPYGVEVSQVTITDASPPAAFLRSEEARELAILQRTEQAEQHVLAQRRQHDAEELAHQQVLAQVARERAALELARQEAENKRQVADIEMATTIARLARLEEALARYPNAAKYDFEGAQLEAVRALAANTRAVVQLGSPEALGQALLFRDVLQPPASDAREQGTAGSPGDAQGNGQDAAGTANREPSREPGREASDLAEVPWERRAS